jgi:hypothetical protein
MKTIRSVTSIPDKKAYTKTLIDTATRAHRAVALVGEVRLTYIKRLKAKKIRSEEERVAERLVYSKRFDIISSERGGNVADGLLSGV